MLIFPLAALVCLAGCQLSGWGTQAWLPRGTGNLSPPTGDRTTQPALDHQGSLQGLILQIQNIIPVQDSQHNPEKEQG